VRIGKFTPYLTSRNRSNHGSFSRKMGVLGYSHHAQRISSWGHGTDYKGQLHSYARGSTLVTG
jgi:hypothetical protein